MSEFAKAIAGKTAGICQRKTVLGMLYDQIESVLRFRSTQLTWLKLYLQNTLTAKANGEKVTLWVYWTLTQWFVKKVSTPSQSHFLPLIATLTF